mmetsp:Transcript_6915/g.9277  ORF Transcript_6915/g.9277 Transcript_6915/m.9277 type:complete len:108 (-) Transcript_6915:244-567(-)
MAHPPPRMAPWATVEQQQQQQQHQQDQLVSDHHQKAAKDAGLEVEKLKKMLVSEKDMVSALQHRIVMLEQENSSLRAVIGVCLFFLLFRFILFFKQQNLDDPTKTIQ